MKLNPLNGTFGLPPSTHVSDSVMYNSMPVMDITPGKPNFESGLTLFRVDDDWVAYRKILATLGFELPDNQIRLAFIADNFPTDTFSNEYGETFLQKFTDVASQGMQQVVQMTGSRKFSEATGKLGNAFKRIGDSSGGMMGDIISGAGAGFEQTGAALESLKTAMSGNKIMGGAAETIDKMMGGYRVDFPQIWRNSSFTPSYTATIRLYNPNPARLESTTRHIIGPLAVILCLAIPRSDDGKTFNWPFFHKIKAAGIYGLDPAVITNITVVKGGDQQQIAYNQQLGMVDVRIDFTSLYNTMVLEETKTFEAQRPTVQNYLSSLQERDTTLYATRNQMREHSGMMAGAGEGPNVKISALSSPSNTGIQNSVEVALAKNEAARRRQAPTVSQEVVNDRVPSTISDIESQLIAGSNPDFIDDAIDIII